MKVSATILLAAALGASAHPSGHAHKRAHQSLEQRGFVIAKKPVTITQVQTITQAQAEATVAPTTTSSTSVAAVSTSSAAAAETSSASSSSGSSSSGSGASSYKAFCGGNSKRATAAEIAYKGNTGSGSDYGCNLMLIESSIADKYDYTITFENAADEEQSCVCWNKIGPSGLIDGFFKGNEALTFNLAAGGSQVLAVDSDSQGGCACATDSVPTVPATGEFGSTWLEFDMANTSNNGWSGADASCIVAAAEGLTIPGLKVCGSGTCSTINPGGTGTNAFLGGSEAMDGIGLNLPAGKVQLTATVGYQG